jgi:hypothetical protein
VSAEPGKEPTGLRTRTYVAEGHGVNGSTSVSKTESLGSNPSAPAKQSSLDPEGYLIKPDGIAPYAGFYFSVKLARTDPEGYLIEPDGESVLSGGRFIVRMCPAFSLGEQCSNG